MLYILFVEQPHIHQAWALSVIFSVLLSSYCDAPEACFSLDMSDPDDAVGLTAPEIDDFPAKAAEEAEKAAIKRFRKQNPQKTIDDFWANFTIKHPGQASTLLPDNLYAKRAARNAPKGVVPAHNAAASFEEAAATCKAKVDKIVKEHRRINQKYRDPHFDLDIDLKMGTYYCLNGLIGGDGPGVPASVKRVGDIFEDPKFFIDGASAEDVKQGRDGDCWFLAALCTLSNMENLIPRICVARDESE